jgi:glutathione S-transferase
MIQLILNPASSGYFRSTREAMFGSQLENLLPAQGVKDEATWGAFLRGLEKLAAIYARNDSSASHFSSGSGAVWLFGDRFTFGDTIVVGFLQWMKLVLGETSEEWKAIEGSAGGHWARQLQAADKWIKG